MAQVSWHTNTKLARINILSFDSNSVLDELKHYDHSQIKQTSSIISNNGSCQGVGYYKMVSKQLVLVVEMLIARELSRCEDLSDFDKGQIVALTMGRQGRELDL